MKFKKTVINNKIVYANWFLRQLASFYDFVYFHILPIKTWDKLINLRYRIKYAFQRAFTGFDCRISWGPESTISFYKRLLGDLYKNCNGWPGSLKEICHDEWNTVREKWIKIIGEEKFNSASDFAHGYSSLSEEQREEFDDDCFKAWKSYILRVLNYFNEADPKTCSMKNEYDGEFKWEWDKDITVEERNGEFYYVRKPKNYNDEQEKKNKLYIDREREIENYQAECL